MLLLLLLTLVFYIWVFASLSYQLRYTFRQLGFFSLNFCFLTKKKSLSILISILLVFHTWNVPRLFNFNISGNKVRGRLFIFFQLYWGVIEKYKLCIFEVYNMMLWYTYTLWWFLNIDTQMSSGSKFQFAVEHAYTVLLPFPSPHQAAYLQFICLVHVHLQAGELGIEKCNYFHIC